MESQNDTSSKTTEERILEAAEREFLSKGYAGARTTAIAEAAGVTHTMLHYYFHTKEGLFNRIIESKIGSIRDIMLESVGNPDMPLFDKIESVISNHLDFIAANPELPRFMTGEILSRPERVPLVIDVLCRHVSDVVQSLQNQINEYADRGVCRRVDAAMLILDIVSLNIFPFMASSMANPILGRLMDDREAFIAARKKSNIETIMRKLKP